MFFGTTIKDEHANSVVKTGMEGGILILVQLETTTIPTTSTPSLDATTEDLRVDVRVAETKAIIMEK